MQYQAVSEYAARNYWKCDSFVCFCFKQVTDDALDENQTITPVIYEDSDESDEEESEDGMETDEGSKEEEALNGLSDIEGSDGMSEWLSFNLNSGCCFANIGRLKMT